MEKMTLTGTWTHKGLLTPVVTMKRTVRLEIYSWGVFASCEDAQANSKLSCFNTRVFRITPRFDTIEKNIERAKKFFHVD